MKFSLPQMTIKSHYEMSGRILILPISGSGPSYLILRELTFTYDFPYEISKKNGKDYVKPIKGQITYDFKGMKLQFDNLFNGDKLLGPETNNFLNENWKEVSKELGPGVAEALAEVVHLILSNVSDLVPYDDLFPEKL
ncbi:protein takeout precursor, putative [Pediculus humanus corporis]|uniref:Protein takeout, putative n=1 Tax=Pediculus humanus subsp. corporis TaxID=121224 RepID=E0VZK5_PEDHC|nr:protein takeout precursor, putative [Pediculus humanus corporis]EEB18811.1 protein takeout precursor, putative [Pediculus humanus corporis]